MSGPSLEILSHPLAGKVLARAFQLQSLHLISRDSDRAQLLPESVTWINPVGQGGKSSFWVRKPKKSYSVKKVSVLLQRWLQA